MKSSCSSRAVRSNAPFVCLVLWIALVVVSARIFIYLRESSEQDVVGHSDDDEMSASFRRKHEEMRRRLERVREVCAKYGDALKWREDSVSNYDHMLVDYEHKFGVCRNAKAGTSTLVSHFLSLPTNVTEEERQGWRRNERASARRLFQTGIRGMSAARMEDHLRREGIWMATFVRHPFERVVSAFEDKILHNDNYREMAERVRSNFTLFARMVADEVAGCGRDRKCAEVNCHWRPFYAGCAYCDISYMAVGKTETYEADLAYVVAAAGVSDRLPEESLGLVKHSVPHTDGRTASYMSTLDGETARRLRDAYSLDFELFDYSADEYMPAAG